MHHRVHAYGQHLARPSQHGSAGPARVAREEVGVVDDGRDVYVGKGGADAAHGRQHGEAVAKTGQDTALHCALLTDKDVCAVLARRATTPNHAARAAIGQPEQGEQLWACRPNRVEHGSPRDGGVGILAVPGADDTPQRLVVRVSQPGGYRDRHCLHPTADAEAELAHLHEDGLQLRLARAKSCTENQPPEGAAHADGAQVGVAGGVRLGRGAVRLHLDKSGEGAVQHPRGTQLRGEAAAEHRVGEDGDGLHDVGALATVSERREVLLGEEVQAGGDAGAEAAAGVGDLHLSELEGTQRVHERRMRSNTNNRPLHEVPGSGHVGVALHRGRLRVEAVGALAELACIREPGRAPYRPRAEGAIRVKRRGGGGRGRGRGAGGTAVTALQRNREERGPVTGSTGLQVAEHEVRALPGAACAGGGGLGQAGCAEHAEHVDGTRAAASRTPQQVRVDKPGKRQGGRRDVLHQVIPARQQGSAHVEGGRSAYVVQRWIRRLFRQ